MAPKTAPKAAAKADAKAKPEAKAKAKVKKEDAEEEKPKVPQPNREEFEAKIEKFQTEITKLQAKQKELSDKIQERSSGKEEFYAKKAELRAQLDEISGKIDGLQAKKEEINKAVGDKRDQDRAKRQDLNTMKKSIGFSSEQEIDNRIASIEFQLCTESVPLKEEKKLLAEIQQLKKNRSKVGQVQQMEQNLSSAIDPSMSMKEQREAIATEMGQYRDEKRKIQEKMTELSESRKQQLGPIEEIQNERNTIGDALRKKIEERNECREEFRRQEREYNQHLGEIRRARQEKYAAEKAERQKEYDLRRKQREADKLDDQPHVAEITLIEQTIKYCKSLVQSKVEEKKAEAKEVVHTNPEGSEVLISKKDREEEFYFAPTKGKKTGKKKSQGETKVSKITHNAETFRLFDQLKLDAPLSTEQVPGLLEQLETQLEEYKVKVKEWEEKREEMKKAILEGLTEIEEKKAARDEEEEKAEEKAEEKEEEKEEEG